MNNYGNYNSHMNKLIKIDQDKSYQMSRLVEQHYHLCWSDYSKETNSRLEKYNVRSPSYCTC